MDATNSADLRFATLHDIPALVALVTSAYRGDASRAGWTTEADLLDGARIDAERLAADIERPQSVILLGEADGGQLSSRLGDLVELARLNGLHLPVRG